jgi:hypothetical protein
MLIPDEYLKLAIEKNPKGWGAAIVTDGLQIAKGEDHDVEFVKNTIAEFEKNDITFYLCNSDAALNKDDISPHTIIHKDGVPQLVAFIDGKFPAHEKTGSSHPGSFFIANEYLIPKLRDVWDLTDGNLVKVMDFIKKPLFKNELLLNVVDYGAVTLVSATGEALSFTKGDHHAEYKWGWVSENYGYAVAAQEQKKEEPPPKRSMFSGKSTVREKAPGTTGNAVDKPPPSDAAVIKNYKVVKWSPQKNASRSQKKDGYKARIGYLPEGWANGVEVDVYADSTGKILTISEVKKLGLAAAGLPKLENVKEKEYVESATTGSTVKKVVDEILPIMAPATRDHIKKIMSDPEVHKIIGENAEAIHDPTKIKELETQFASFSNQLGMKSIDDFIHWSYPMMYELGKERLDGLAVMAWTFKNMLAGARAKESKVKTEDAPEIKPEKRSMFSKKVA